MKLQTRGVVLLCAVTLLLSGSRVCKAQQLTEATKKAADQLHVTEYVQALNDPSTTPQQALLYLAMINSGLVQQQSSIIKMQQATILEQKRLFEEMDRRQSNRILNLVKANAIGSGLSIAGTSMAFSSNKDVVNSGRGVSIAGATLAMFYAICTTNGLEYKCPRFLRTNPTPSAQKAQLLSQQPVAPAADQSANIDILSNWVQEQAKSILQKLKQTESDKPSAPPNPKSPDPTE